MVGSDEFSNFVLQPPVAVDGHQREQRVDFLKAV